MLAPDNLTLAQLHQVIQVAMGWHDDHRREFKIEGVRYGVPYPEFGDEVLDESRVRLSQLLGAGVRRFHYVYDFGDRWMRWMHVLEVEKTLPYEADQPYPVCLAGKRACPPEDVGGVWGYETFLEAIRDPSHPDHEFLLEWVGGEFDPEAFDIVEVNRVLASRSP